MPLWCCTLRSHVTVSYVSSRRQRATYRTLCTLHMHWCWVTSKLSLRTLSTALCTPLAEFRWSHSSSYSLCGILQIIIVIAWNAFRILRCKKICLVWLNRETVWHAVILPEWPKKYSWDIFEYCRTFVETKVAVVIVVTRIIFQQLHSNRYFQG